ncbi:MAG TPA: hypothetical protein PKD27_09545, partial [Tepidiformaceae bacterium]|nr:hypothetical protein [Tepidiformaceae bacterium]
MVKHSYRPLFAAAALVMALAGAVSVAMFGAGQTPAIANNLYVIEVNTQGFNPRQCNINRGDRVTFKNVSAEEMHILSGYRDAQGVIIAGGFGGLPPRFDRTLAPDEQFVGSEQFDAGGDYFYVSEYGHYVTVSTPKTQNTGLVSCAKEAPTPTPTPT